MKIIGFGVAALTAGVLLTGCAQPGTTMEAGASAAEEGDAIYNRTVTKLYGTAEQRQAAEQLSWLTSQAAVAACATTKGVDYAVTPYVQMVPDTGTAPGDVLAFAPGRTDFGVATRIKTLAARGEPVNPGLAKTGDDQAAQDKWFKATEECQEAGHAGEALTTPKGQGELDAKFVATLTEIQDKAAPTLAADYKACMAAAGIESGSLSDTYRLVEGKFPPVSYETASDATKAEGWAAAAAFETKAADADWACRKDRTDQVFAAAVGALTAFEQDNAAALAEVGAGWSAKLNDAQKALATTEVVK